MLAQHWKPQDGGDLMLGVHFSVFPRKKKSHPIMFGLSFPVLSGSFFLRVSFLVHPFSFAPLLEKW